MAKKLLTRYNKEDILKLLENDKAVVRAIVVLYTYQTTSEQKRGETIEHNNVGFNSPDGVILSKFARYINKGYKLSDKQIALARAKILKYAGQLARISNEKWRKQQIA